MANLSITTAWNETVAFIAREARLVLPIAFLLLALPGAAMQLVIDTNVVLDLLVFRDPRAAPLAGDA